MRKILFLFSILLFSAAVSSLTINEIMYNPSTEQGSDTSLEWIEIYNDGNTIIDLSDWKIDSYNFDNYNISSEEYIIIARTKDDFVAYYNPSNYTVLDGYFSLSNTGDSINLSDGTTDIIVSYDNSLGADGNGKTLEYYDSEWFESFYINGTPGSQNSVFGFSTDYSVIEINEFMPDPIGDDDFDMPNGEWVELYNSGNMPLNLKDLVLYDNDDSHELYITDTDTLQGTTILAKGYLVIYRNGDSDFNLNNNGADEIRLYDGYPVAGSNLIDSLTYSNTIENKSWSNIDEIWKKTPATPGEININITLEYDYSVLTINEFFPDPLGDDSVPMPGGEWIELYNPSSSEIDTSGMLLTDLNNQKLYISSTTTTQSTLIQPQNYITIYINGQSGFLNNEGMEKISLFDKNGNFIDKAEYADSKEGMSWSKIEEIWQRTMPTPGQDNVGNETNIDSHIKIEKIYDLGSDKKAKFGQTIRVLLKIFKGSTTKSSIRLWAEDENGESISKESKTNVYTYFTNYTLTLPLQLTPNCDHDYPDGNYTLLLEGLDKQDTYDFIVEDITKDVCEYVEVDESEKQDKGVKYSLIDFQDTIFIGDEFESKIKIENNDDTVHKFEIWSYVYKGSKSYSGEREENKITKYLAEKSSKTIILENLVSEAEEGLYKFKVKILKDDLKTPYEITKELIIEDKNKEKVEGTINESLVKVDSMTSLESGENRGESGKTEDDDGTVILSNPRIIYQSTSVKAKNLIPHFLISILVFLVIFLSMRKL